MTQQLHTISVTEFRANCDAIIECVSRQHKNIVITKYKKPIAKLIPYEDKPISLCGALKGTVKINGNIVDESLFTT